MSRRTLALTSSALLVLASVTACSTSSSSNNAAAPSPSATQNCAKTSLNLVKNGVLTVGTDKPAYDPYFSKNDPTNGKGFESAVAYAIAKQLGFAKSEVKWITVPFNSSYAPGKKNFDVDINETSITPQRQKAVTFSSPYYDSPQAVIALKGTPAAAATSIADLKALKIGVQVGTTSLQVVNDTIKPTTQPQVFNDTAAATAALKNKQVAAVVVDLPTASYITNVELSNGTILGQLPGTQGSSWGLLLAKNNALVGCVNKAVEALKADGTLAALQTQELPFIDVPVLK